MTNVRPYWVSWWDDLEEDFELLSPWWQTGARILNLGDNLGVQQYSICAAVMATSPENAKILIVEAYHSDVSLEWRFVEEQPLGWSPFSSRLPRRDNMVWSQKPH